MPIWVKWYSWGCPPAWTLYGVFASQFGDDERLVRVPGKPTIPVKVYLKETYGYELRYLKYAALFQIGFVSLFIFVFTYAIMFKNFQRRWEPISWKFKALIDIMKETSWTRTNNINGWAFFHFFLLSGASMLTTNRHFSSELSYLLPTHRSWRAKVLCYWECHTPH